MSKRPLLVYLQRLRSEWLIVALVTGLAASLRLCAIDHLPAGLYHDEAFNGLDALQVLHGQFPIFFEANHGREPLFIYLLAASVRLWGRSPGALRIVSAIVGTLTVPVLYALGRELFGKSIGIIAALLAATTIWTINLSRIAFRAVTLPPIMALVLLLLWRGWQQKRYALMVSAGLVWGASFYTYLAARFSVVALLFIILYLTAMDQKRMGWPGWMLFAASALLVALPLGFYWLGHWQSTIGRADQVSIFNSGINGGDFWGTLLRHVWRTARGFFYRGDFIPRHNVPWRAVFPPLVAGAFFLGGVIATLRARKLAAFGYCLIWTVVMLLPTILAEDAPHMLRASGALPMLFFLPAIGLDAVRRWVSRKNVHLANWGLAAVFLASGLSNVLAYREHLHSETAYYNFEAGAVEMAVDINRFLGSGWQGSGLVAGDSTGDPERRVYITKRLWRNWPSVRYLCPQDDQIRILEASLADLPQGSGEVMLVSWPFEFDRSWLEALPRPRLIDIQIGAQERGDLESESRLMYLTAAAYQARRDLPRQAVSFAEGIRLAGYDIAQEPQQQTLRLSLYWEGSGQTTDDYTVFCHVVRDGQIIGQHDGTPAWGYYPTNLWRAGDTIQDTHMITLSVAYEPDHDQVLVGLYQPSTMERLSVVDAQGASTGQTYTILGD